MLIDVSMDLITRSIISCLVVTDTFAFMRTSMGTTLGHGNHDFIAFNIFRLCHVIGISGSIVLIGIIFKIDITVTC